MGAWTADGDLSVRIWQGRYDIDDVLEISHQPDKDVSRFELLDGTLYEHPPAGMRHGFLAGDLLFHIHDLNKRDGLGLVTARCGYHPPDDRWTLLGPSVAFTRKERVQYPLSQTYAARMPDLAVEVDCFCNPYDWIGRKLPKYLNNGAQLVWVVIPDEQGVEVHRLDESGNMRSDFIGADGVLSGEEVLPGFELALSTLFP